MEHPFKTPAQLAVRRYEAKVIKRPVMALPGPTSLEDAAIVAFINDVAMGLVEMDVIAARYGINVMEAIELAEAPGIAERIRTKRGIWESEDNVTERNRVCYGLIALDAAAVLDRTIHNPTTPASVVIDAMKVVGRFGGLDYVPKGDQGQQGPAT